MKSPYEELIEQVDELAGRLAEKYAAHLTCRAGCSGCCQHHLSLFPVEAEALREAIAGMTPEMRARLEAQARGTRERELRKESVSCPALVEDRCALYAVRPVICRTQGLPLLFEDAGGESEVDFCPLNFTSPAAVASLEEDALVPLDAINLKLAVANLLHGRARGIDSSAVGERISMADIILGA